MSEPKRNDGVAEFIVIMLIIVAVIGGCGAHSTQSDPEGYQNDTYYCNTPGMC